MRTTFAIVAFLAATSGPALALNPQPLPPMEIKPNMDLVLADGSIAHVSSDGNHLTTLKGGKQVALPPGPCKLKAGITIVVGPSGLVQSIGSQTGGAGAGKLDNPVK